MSRKLSLLNCVDDDHQRRVRVHCHTVRGKRAGHKSFFRTGDDHDGKDFFRAGVGHSSLTNAFALSLVLGKSGNGGLANRLNPVLPAVIDQLDLGLQQLALMRKNLWKLHGPIVRSLFRQQRFTDDPDLAKLPCPCGSGRDFCKCCG